MTFPSANPGGQHRRLIRHTLKAWVDAQEIAGIGLVYPGMKPELSFESDPDSNPDFDCIVRIAIPSCTEDRGAYTGPVDPGGKVLHYACEFHIHHRGYNPDEWEESEDDYDRITDALKDALRGHGRDLGRPDVILQVGEFPRQAGISDRHEEPVDADGGIVERWGVISFQVTQYLPTFVP